MATTPQAAAGKRRHGPKKHLAGPFEGGYIGYFGKLDGVEWPPGFRSETCNPESPHSMVKTSAVAASKQSTANRDRLSESGVWAAIGFLGALSSKPQKITSYKKSSQLMMKH